MEVFLVFLVLNFVAVECATGANDGSSFLEIFSEHLSRINSDNRRREKEKEISNLSRMETPDFIKHYGYPCETHEVITKDQYILRLHRIPYGINGNATEESRPVVYLQHGILSYSGDWFISGPEKALGFILADAGYDVWVGNSRGNKYSRRHMHLDPDTDGTFWDFSWHEMGIYDLPATIDHITAYTNHDKLFYIGHSQGTTIYYVLLSEFPEYNNKIHAQYSLAPVAYTNHLYGPGMKYLKNLESLFNVGADLLQIHELNGETPIFKYVTKKLCVLKSMKKFCINEIFTITGFDYQQFNESLLPIIISNFPAGSSLKQLKHFAQGMRSGEFQQFDYGYSDNEQIYGSYFPPKYKLCNVRAPTHLLYSHNDFLSSPDDVDRLFHELPEGDKYPWEVSNKKWNHIDYLYGIDAKTVIYNLIIENMKRFLNS